MPFGFPDIFEVKPIEAPAQWIEPKFANEEELKKQFGIELGKGPKNLLDAALKVFDDTSTAMWAISKWVNDPIVQASKDLYLKTTAQQTSLLDKDAFAARLLEFAEEKVLIGDRHLPAHEGKDRLAALRLYAEVKQFIGKGVDIDNSTNINNNHMTIKLVRAGDKSDEGKVLNLVAEKPVLNPPNSPIKVKLVSNSR